MILDDFRGDQTPDRAGIIRLCIEWSFLFFFLRFLLRIPEKWLVYQNASTNALMLDLLVFGTLLTGIYFVIYLQVVIVYKFKIRLKLKPLLMGCVGFPVLFFMYRLLLTFTFGFLISKFFLGFEISEMKEIFPQVYLFDVIVVALDALLVLFLFLGLLLQTNKKTT